MRLTTLKYFHEKSAGQYTSFHYRGPFLEKFTNTILDVSQSASKKETQAGIGKKVSFMLVECFQNILKHAENHMNVEHTMSDDGMFSFNNMPGAFVINSINVIKNSDIERLVGMVSQVNTLNDDDLKTLYLDRLKNNTISEKGGAGLGLIEMARKSKQKILYRIDILDGTHSLFHQQITIKRDDQEIAEYADHIELSRELYNRMSDENLVLLYKGDFSQKSIMPLLELAEHNIQDKSHGRKRTFKAAHVTVEMLQNISKHSKMAEDSGSRFGIFMLGKENDSLCILAGNVVTMNEKIFLEEKLDYLISLDNDELRDLHARTLRSTLRFENKKNSGLGLIEVAKASSNSMKFKFFPYKDNQFLFALQVII